MSDTNGRVVSLAESARALGPASRKFDGQHWDGWHFRGCYSYGCAATRCAERRAGYP